MLLACYRIAEQGLLNAVVHGNSTKAILEIAPVDTGQLQILLTDNGKSGADTEITPGLGSAVLDSWCRMFAGEWKLDILPAGGARLTARIEFAHPAIAGLTPQ
jgi:signal transduction histidine kinase